MLISEEYKKRIQKLAGLHIIEEKIDFTSQDLTKAYDKSWQRVVGFNIDMIKEAIKEGRAIGISYKSNNMPVIKFRVVLPVTLGTYKTKSGVKTKLSAFHLAGQSERSAERTGKRSQEAKNEWRLFDLSPAKFKSMWFTDSYFYEYPPGYKKGDKRFESITDEYDAGKALAEKISREENGKEEGIPINLKGIVANEPQEANSEETETNSEETGTNQEG